MRNRPRKIPQTSSQCPRRGSHTPPGEESSQMLACTTSPSQARDAQSRFCLGEKPALCRPRRWLPSKSASSGNPPPNIRGMHTTKRVARPHCARFVTTHAAERKASVFSHHIPLEKPSGKLLVEMWHIMPKSLHKYHSFRGYSRIERQKPLYSVFGPNTRTHSSRMQRSDDPKAVASPINRMKSRGYPIPP